MIRQIEQFSYCNSVFFGHPVGERLAAELVQGTDGVMNKAYIMSSGIFLPVLNYPSIQKWLISFCRLRSNGSGHEDGATIFYRSNTKTDTKS
jgi:hypothetical protein